ncbi:hypothetical protein pipiens_001536 [Culex pipiens pipiens]|uniref:Uncharacterized protein n=1 Tax=Culex pipiens pipiens TaxID=38569 RepID=A0ABD1CML5_CULPP
MGFSPLHTHTSSSLGSSLSSRVLVVKNLKIFSHHSDQRDLQPSNALHIPVCGACNTQNPRISPSFPFGKTGCGHASFRRCLARVSIFGSFRSGAEARSCEVATQIWAREKKKSGRTVEVKGFCGGIRYFGGGFLAAERDSEDYTPRKTRKTRRRDVRFGVERKGSKCKKCNRTRKRSVKPIQSVKSFLIAKRKRVQNPVQNAFR